MCSETRLRICNKNKGGGKKGQNCSSLATVWGGYLQHLRLVDKDLR